jgi:hypothetical protein
MGTAGRKPKPLDLVMVEKCAALGMTDTQIAAASGICLATLYKRKRDNSQFLEAIERGQAKGVQLVASKLMEQVNVGNAQLIKFYLEAKGGWVTTTIVEAGTINLEGKSAAEVRAILESTPRQS